MAKIKRPLGIVIISIGAIIYALLDIGQLFMPVTTESQIEYSIPFLGILFLIFGIGLFLLKDWARKGMMASCILAIIQSVSGILQSSPINIISLIFIFIFGLIIYYFTRATVKNSLT